MGNITYGTTLTEDTTASADEVMGNFVNVSTVVNGGIDSTNLATNAVSAVKIQADAVTTAKILDANVTNPKLATNAVDTANIVDLAVTGGKIASGTVDTTQLTDLSVTTAKIDTGAVSESKLATDAVTPTKIQAEAIIETKIDWNKTTGVRALRIGGTGGTRFGNEGLCIVRCETVVASKAASVTVTFSTEAVDGNPSFVDAVIHPVGMEYISDDTDEVDVPDKIYIVSGSITSAQAQVKFEWDVTCDSAGVLYSTWIGKTAV